MLIGNTIKGFAKLTRLLKLAQKKRNRSIKSHLLMLNFAANSQIMPAFSQSIKLGSTVNPVPEDLLALLFMKDMKYMEFANNNSAVKGAFAKREAVKATNNDPINKVR